MNNTTFDRASLRLSATLLLVGQISYVLVTLLHTGGEANHHAAIFAAYASSGTWAAVHAAQFACMAIFLAGLFALFFALEAHTEAVRWAGRFGAASAVVTLALCGGVLAVDGVALKQAVTAWANAPEAEKAARFAVAEGVRWLEWGMRSYENFALGLAVLLCAVALLRTVRVPRPIGFLMGLAAVTYFVQGWIAGTQGFSDPQTITIVMAEVLNAVWITWLLVVAWRAPQSTFSQNGSHRPELRVT
jgi:hypothetical protein